MAFLEDHSTEAAAALQEAMSVGDRDEPRTVAGADRVCETALPVGDRGETRMMAGADRDESGAPRWALRWRRGRFTILQSTHFGIRRQALVAKGLESSGPRLVIVHST